MFAIRAAGWSAGSATRGRISRGCVEMTNPAAGWSPHGQLTRGTGSEAFCFRQQLPLAARALAAARRQHPQEHAFPVLPQQQPAGATELPAIPALPTGTPTLPAQSAASVMSAVTRGSNAGC
jgi:hypothetical protein